ncbi:TRAF3-interacting JNK-activating modulator [Sorex fumeus]|uniref:TRAF3-interacting JNK-activating modulator n=1 Tax=Sorex fumeus TaxID=62283 RepID=UPI0024AD0C05|nr:TRAF3-interacting JNK-activating modulator [Sorex fumeus]
MLSREPEARAQVWQRLQDQEGWPDGCSEAPMPGPGPRRAPRRIRRPETYEAKCERRQEARESRRWRPNVTTCRPAGKVARDRLRERLQGARQRQLLLRRRLGGPEVAGSESLLRKQLPGASPEFCHPPQHPPPSGGPGDLAGPRPHKLHCGTQTLAEGAKPPGRRDTSQQTNCGVAVLDQSSLPHPDLSRQEIVQLSEYLKEALQRELVLKQKMVLLQDLLATLTQTSHDSWTGQLNEDKLRSRLHTLESQLHTCTQKATPRGLRKALLEMEQRQSSYELQAKELLWKVLEEKRAAEQQLRGTQRSLALAEQQCAEWRTRCQALQAGGSSPQGQRSSCRPQGTVQSPGLEAAAGSQRDSGPHGPVTTPCPGPQLYPESLLKTSGTSLSPRVPQSDLGGRAHRITLLVRPCADNLQAELRQPHFQQVCCKMPSHPPQHQTVPACPPNSDTRVWCHHPMHPGLVPLVKQEQKGGV